jgi:hypothetical protein
MSPLPSPLSFNIRQQARRPQASRSRPHQGETIMSVMRGHEDLQPKTIVGFDMGYALVQCGGQVKRYMMQHS